jgi:hypothetical protein
MVGEIIGGVLNLGASIFGGVSAAKSAAKQRAMIEEQRAKNQDWYNRRYNEDGTQRADAVRLMQLTEDSIRKRNRQAEGTSAVMGGSQEALAAAREDNNQAIASTMSGIAAASDARKDNIERQYMARDDSYSKQLQDVEAQKQQAIAGAVKGVASAAGGLAGSLEDSLSGGLKDGLKDGLKGGSTSGLFSGFPKLI